MSAAVAFEVYASGTGPWITGPDPAEPIALEEPLL